MNHHWMTPTSASSIYSSSPFCFLVSKMHARSHATLQSGPVTFSNQADWESGLGDIKEACVTLLEFSPYLLIYVRQLQLYSQLCCHKQRGIFVFFSSEFCNFSTAVTARRELTNSLATHQHKLTHNQPYSIFHFPPSRFTAFCDSIRQAHILVLISFTFSHWLTSVIVVQLLIQLQLYWFLNIKLHMYIILFSFT